MREFLRESIIDYFNDQLVSVTKGDFVRAPVTGLTLRRDDELDLVFELTSRGWSKERAERYPAGTVRAADEVIEFRHAAGWIGAARVLSGAAHGLAQRATGRVKQLKPIRRTRLNWTFRGKPNRLT